MCGVANTLPRRTANGQSRNSLRLAILATHPIQYHTPWYRGLAADGRLQVKVFYCHRATPGQQAEAGFGVPFEWDIPLLDGYEYEFLENVASNPQTSSFSGLDVPGIYKSLGAEGFDAVLVNGWNHKACWQTVWAAKRLGIPVLVRGDSHLHTPRSEAKSLVKDLAYPWMLRLFDGYLSVGQWSREYYVHYGVPENQVFHVPHVIDEALFTKRDKGSYCTREATRMKWNLPTEAIVFLFVGKFTALKNPTLFLDALRRSHGIQPNIAGFMVGDGPESRSCEVLAREWQVPVTLAGFINQTGLPEIFSASDVLVLPSAQETWGIVVNEAMWSGLPCIVSDQVGCGPDLIAGKGTGEVFPVGDHDALAQAMVQLAGNAEYRRGCSARAKELIKQYSVSSAVEGTVQAVISVVKESVR